MTRPDPVQMDFFDLHLEDRAGGGEGQRPDPTRPVEPGPSCEAVGADEHDEARQIPTE